MENFIINKYIANVEMMRNEVIKNDLCKDISDNILKYSLRILVIENVEI